jgi:multidrug efflux pump
VKGINLSAWALAHRPLMRYLMVVLVLGGIAAFLQLGQDEDPPFTFRAMVVRTFWPGATAPEVADQVTDRLERTLQQVPWVDKIASYSKPGESLIIVQLQEATPPREVAGVWYQVRKKIGDMRLSLPSEVQGPHFNDEFGDVYGVMFAFSGDGFTYRQVKDAADWARQQLLRVPGVAKVDLFGVQDERVTVEIPSRRLAQIGLTVPQLAAQIGSQNTVEAAGMVAAPVEDVRLRVTGALRSVEELRELRIRAGQVNYRLADIALVRREYVDPPLMKMHAGRGGRGASGPHEVVGLGVTMVKGGDIVELGRALEGAEARLNAELPVGIEMFKVADQPRAVARSVGEFIGVLREALAVVLAVSFLSLGLHMRPLRIDMRPGAVVALTIPLVLAITFLAMYLLGINLHKISLGALIISLGLLVDDAIIAVEMMLRKMEEGFDRVRAATFTFETTAMPMLSGTLITAAGFLPIALARSTAGEYTLAIFQVTAIALVVSWVAAVMFVPLLGVWLLRPPARVHAATETFQSPFYVRFRALVDRCLERRWLVIGATAAALALSIAAFGAVERQFFPSSNRLEIMVDLWLPQGAGFAASEAEAGRFEAWLDRQPELDTFAGYVGSGSPRFYLPQDQQFEQANLAQFVISTRSIAERDALRVRMLALFRDDFPGVRGRVKLLPSGPPVPYPVQFRVEGDDAVRVRAIADRVKEVLRENPDAIGVNDNWNEPVKVLRLALDQDKARALGVTSQSLVRATQAIVSGAPIGEYREGDQTIAIQYRAPESERGELSRLADVSVPTGNGSSVPLSQLVHSAIAFEPGILWRQNRNYAITVQCEIRDGVQGPTVSQRTWSDARFARIRAELPPGYRVVIAGESEESGKAGGAIAANIPLMLFVVFTLLMLQLHSFGRAMLVFLTGPLGFIGAAASLLVLRAPFGFVAQLGVIALLGMIIRNSVILIDQIERDRAAGVDAWTAIVEAAVRRMRPILLTAAAAVLAMIPLSRSLFWGPMAVAIMGGLVVATALTLLFLPALYAAAFRVRRAGAGARAMPADALRGS